METETTTEFIEEPTTETVETTEEPTEPVEEPELSIEEEIARKAEAAAKDAVTTPQEETTSEDTPTEEETPTEPEAPKYEPNLKYKAYGEEKEFEEWAHGLVNEENEAQFRSMFEKAGGFETLKGNFKELETTHTTLQGNYNELNQVRNDLVNAVESGNLHKAMEILDINDEKLFKYAQERINYHEMSQTDRQVYDARYEAERKNQVLERQLAQQKEMQEQMFMNNHNMNMQTAISNPEVAPLIQQYNTAFGSADAFANRVAEIGNAAHARGEYLAPQDAVRMAIDSVRPLLANVVAPQTPAPQTAQPETPQPVTPAPVAPPTLNGTSSQAVVKKTFGSLEELEKYSQTL